MTALLQRAEAPAGVFPLTIDYNQTLDEMTAAGQYDWFNDDITAERFPITGKGVVTCETKLLHFGCNLTSEEPLRAMKADFWRTPKIEHLLTFGAAYPDEQRKFLIIALIVDTAHGKIIAPFLYGDDKIRGILLRACGGTWHDRCRFLAVRPALRILPSAA